MRNKLILILAVMLTALWMAGCAGQNAPSEAPADATQEPTGAPYIDTRPDEPEWTLYEGDLQLEDQKNIYAESADILYFAIVTMDDGAQELRFKLNDETAAMLAQQSADNAYYMTFNGEKIGSATLSEDCSVVIITSENAVDEITTLATKIRGVLS